MQTLLSVSAKPSTVQLKVPAVRTYSEYLDPSISLGERIGAACREEKISLRDRKRIQALLAPLKAKHLATYEHCVRVGLVARDIAGFLRLDTKALFMAGVLHDVGKALCPVELLAKTSGWNAADSKLMQRHVVDGARMLRGIFDFSAEVILWHHRFQPDGYPKRLPRSAHPFSLATKTAVAQYGRVLALADTFDALHRINDRHGAGNGLSGIEIKEKMFEYNPDAKALLERLYRRRVLTN